MALDMKKLRAAAEKQKKAGAVKKDSSLRANMAELSRKPQPIAASKLVPITHIKARPQVRTEFDENELRAMANNMKRNGQILPISVLDAGDDGIFYIVDGERRWRAAQIAGITTMKVDVYGKELTPQQLRMIQLSANLVRSDLSILDLFKSFKECRDEGMDINTIAANIERPRNYVSDILVLDGAPEDLFEYFKRNKFTDPKLVSNLVRCAKENPDRFYALFDEHLKNDTPENHISRAESERFRRAFKQPIQSEVSEDTSAEQATDTAAGVANPAENTASESAVKEPQSKDDERNAALDDFYAEASNDPEDSEEFEEIDNETSDTDDAGMESAETETKSKTKSAKPASGSRWILPKGCHELPGVRALCFRVTVRLQKEGRTVMAHGTLMSNISNPDEKFQNFLYQGQVMRVANDQISGVEGCVVADNVTCEDDYEEAL